MTNSSIRFCSALLAFLLTLSGTFGAPDWQGDYLRGVEKYKSGNYNEAIRLISRAVAEKPASCDKCIRDGMFFDDYYPNFYLGTAYLFANQPRQALNCFEVLNREGKIQRTKLSGQFQSNYAQARERAGAATPQPTPVQPTPVRPQPTPVQPTPVQPQPVPVTPQPVQPTPTPFTPVQPTPVQPQPVPVLPSTPATVKPATPGVSPIVDGFKRDVAAFEASVAGYGGGEYMRYSLLRNAFTRLKQGVSSFRASTDRLRLDTEIPSARQELERQKQLVAGFVRDYERVRALRLKADAIGRAFSALPEQEAMRKPAVFKEYTAVRTKVTDMQRAIQQDIKDWKALDTAEASVTAMQGDIARLAERFGAAGRNASTTLTQTRDARSLLQQAFRAYFGGKFDQASAMVGEMDSLKVVHPYLHLLKGLLELQRYWAAGGTDNAMLERVRASFRTAAQGGMRPESLGPRFFSPKIAKLFSESMQ